MIEERFKSALVGLFIGILCGAVFTIVITAMVFIISWSVGEWDVFIRGLIVFSSIGATIGTIFGYMDGGI